MASVYEVIGWFMSGEGRLVAAALLFLTMWGIKNVPWNKTWLAADSGWLTSKRKKFAASIMLAMGPTVLALSDPSRPLDEVLATTVQVVLAAMGLQGGLKALKPRGDK